MVSLVAAEAGAADAPWWGVPLVAGVFLLLGGVLNASLGALSERRKARHENRRALSTAAARFLVETRQFFDDYESNFIIEAGQVKRTKGRPLQWSDVNAAYWEFVFLAPPDINDAARRLHEATRRFRRQDRATGEAREFRQGEYDRAMQQYYGARAEVVDLVAKHVRQEGGFAGRRRLLHRGAAE